MQGNPNYQGGGMAGAGTGMGNTTGFPNSANPQGTAGQGNGDMLDKGVDYAERRAGHEQVWFFHLRLVLYSSSFIG